MKPLRFSPQANDNLEFSLSNECWGSRHCAGEIHISRERPAAWSEVHLTVAEMKRIRRALKVAIREYEERED